MSKSTSKHQITDVHKKALKSGDQCWNSVILAFIQFAKAACTRLKENTMKIWNYLHGAFNTSFIIFSEGFLECSDDLQTTPWLLCHCVLGVMIPVKRVFSSPCPVTVWNLTHWCLSHRVHADLEIFIGLCTSLLIRTTSLGKINCPGAIHSLPPFWAHLLIFTWGSS